MSSAWYFRIAGGEGSQGREGEGCAQGEEQQVSACSACFFIIILALGCWRPFQLRMAGAEALHLPAGEEGKSEDRTRRGKAGCPPPPPPRRKLAVKLVQRIGLVFLRPRLAAWRYRKGRSALLAAAAAAAPDGGAGGGAPGVHGAAVGAAAGGAGCDDEAAAAAAEEAEAEEDVQHAEQIEGGSPRNLLRIFWGSSLVGGA